MYTQPHFIPSQLFLQASIAVTQETEKKWPWAPQSMIKILPKIKKKKQKYNYNVHSG